MAPIAYQFIYLHVIVYSYLHIYFIDSSSTKKLRWSDIPFLARSVLKTVIALFEVALVVSVQKQIMCHCVIDRHSICFCSETSSILEKIR